MALTTPILDSPIAAFDATQVHSFTFTYIGGDLVGYCALSVFDTNTNVRVYPTAGAALIPQPSGTTYVLAAGTLSNNTSYKAYIQTYATTDTTYSSPSTASAPVQFYCYTTPTFTWENVPTGNLITASSYEFQVKYTQIEGEQLDSYIFNLYDYQGNLVSSSGTKFVGGSTSTSATITYTFSGFSDNTSYYIEVIGATEYKTVITVPKTLFTVKYIKPNVFSLLELTNNCQGGYITVKSNLTNILGKSNPSPPNYVNKDDGTPTTENPAVAVNVKESGQYVTWDSAYQIAGDFTISLWGHNFNVNSTIIILSDASGSNSITIKYYSEPNSSPTTYYATADIVSDGVTYHIYSNNISAPSSTDKVQFWLRRINNLYQLDLYKLGAVATLSGE